MLLRSTNATTDQENSPKSGSQNQPKTTLCQENTGFTNGCFTDRNKNGPQRYIKVYLLNLESFHALTFPKIKSNDHKTQSRLYEVIAKLNKKGILSSMSMKISSPQRIILKQKNMGYTQKLSRTYILNTNKMSEGHNILGQGWDRG